MSRTVEPERIVGLGDGEPDADGRYVLYWMQAAQRAEHNPALELAAQRANDHDVPLVVAAVIIPDYPEASARHFTFMLGGLGQALRAVERRNARPCLRVGDPLEIITELASEACELVLDRGYLRHQRRWYDRLVERVAVRVTQVEGEVVVPIGLVSEQAEHAARTIRPKIVQRRDDFLTDLDTTPLSVTRTPNGTTSDVDIDRLDDHDRVCAAVAEFDVSPRPAAIDWLTPGTAAARSLLDRLLDRVGTYEDDRVAYDEPESSSMLSPYLHFGQISPVAIAVAARDRAGDAAEPFLEELVVRRELAINFVANTPDYDTYGALPGWARTSLDAHRDDDRPHVYTAAELEAGETHDRVWNTIMAQIREQGWVHNQVRMYWGKQIVQWTNTPRHAFRTLLALNNRYFLDGRDPNSYANVGWCFGLHDQGFAERPVTGKLRPFTTAALRRKGDLDAWVQSHEPTDT